MDMQGENVADNDRYAFLLGSALRNGDSEQFFCIYDSIIPKDLPEIQVEKIKDKARCISELPEDNFNELVVNARDFSLARGRPSLSPSLAMSSSVQHVLDDHSDDEDEGTPGHFSRATHLDPHTSTLPHKGSAAWMTDDDSGLPSSTKTGRRTTSLSSEDSTEMEEKGLNQVLPLFKPLQRNEKKREEEEMDKVKMVTRMVHNPPYDEEVPVENDSESVESPRSDASSMREYDVTQLEADDVGGGTEMTTFSSEQRTVFEYEDSDENPHRALYGRLSMERPRASSLSFTRSKGMLARGQTISSLRSGSATSASTNVDESVNFSSLSGMQSKSSLSPPFGNGDDLLGKIGNSICPLVTQTSYNLSKSSFSAETVSGDGKKKKKKKKDGKDEARGEGGSRSKPLMNTDVNGNPLDPQVYKQMRETPRPHESSRGQGPVGTTNHDFSGSRGDLHDMGNKSDDHSSPSGSSANGQAEKRKGRKNARKPGKEIRPEEDPNYVGDVKDIDNLVKFINNDIDKKKLKKIDKLPNQNDSSGIGSHAASTTPLNKNHKKTKDRNKTKQFLTTGVGESAEDSLTPASETTQLLSSAASLTSYSSVVEHTHREPLSEAEEDGASSPDEQEVAKKMGGNSSTSEKPESGISDENPESPKSDSEQGKSNLGTTSEPAHSVKSDTIKNHANHMLSASDKLVTEPKKSGETKDSKDEDSKDKAKPKNGGKDSIKSESARSADNNSNRKSKSKPTKNDVKLATVSDKSSAEVRKEKQDTNKDIAKLKDTQKMTTSPSAVTTPKSPSNFEFENNDHPFLFTDVDRIVKELEFTIVSKKKRRSPNQPVSQGHCSSSQSFSQHHYSRDPQHLSLSQSSNVPYNRNGQRDAPNRTLPTKHRSFTPPPMSSKTGSGSMDKTRDLSPSAFPVLNTTGRTPAKVSPLGTEGRRRSLEDVTLSTGQLFPSDKDSDKESTKSLPADKSVGGRANYPVSYATMASSKTPRQSVDSSKAESLGSSTGDANSDEFPPTPTTSMKWKGSPQERRHSIGSAPEELSKSTSGSNLQRSGSQEVLPRDVDSKDKSAVMALPSAKGMIQSDSAGSFAGSDADSARGSEAGSEATGEVFATPPSGVAVEDKKDAVAEEKKTKPAMSVSKTSTIPVVSVSSVTPQTVISTVSGNSGQPAVPKPVTAGVKSKGTQSSSSSRSQPTTVAVSSKPEPTNKTNSTVLTTPIVTKPVNNGLRKKIVVFCNSSQCGDSNMDVSFGGEPLFSFLEEGQSCSASDVKTSSDNKPAVSASLAKDVASGSISHSSAHPSSTAATTSSSSSNDTNSSTKPPKGPHIAKLNGLVSPQHSDARSPLVLQSVPTVPATTNSSAPAPSQGQTVSQTSGGHPSGGGVSFEGPAVDKDTTNVPRANTESSLSSQAAPADQVTGPVLLNVPEGAIIVTVGARIPDVEPNCKVFLRQEMISEATSQSHTDAVSFLQKEWNKLEKRMKNAPNSVRVYSQE